MLKMIKVSQNEAELELLHSSVSSVKGIMDVLDGMNILKATNKFEKRNG